ncbi:unnamed protein product [Linum trigynum]|uniref:NET domain-containing protein n=1 Tax=Linum trigynum TaxID=586398 RepID=A0AAV2EET7_9ROSI
MERNGDYSDGCRRLRELLPPQAITEERLGQAMDFLDEVKFRLHGKPGNYRTFCSVLEKLADSPIRLIAGGGGGGPDLAALRPEDLLWVVRKILYGQEDLIEKFNSYLSVDPVSVLKPGEAKAAPIRPAIAEEAPRVLPTVPAAAMADLGIQTSSSRQRRHPATSGFVPVVAGAEPPQPAIPLFPSGGGSARREEETCDRKTDNNDTRKADRVVAEVDGKFRDRFAGEKSRCLGWIQKIRRISPSSSEIYQQHLPNLYRYSLGKTPAELAPETEKRRRPDEAEQRCSRTRRISAAAATTPVKDRFQAALLQQRPPAAEAPEEREVKRQRQRLGECQQTETVFPVMEEDADELKERLLSVARYIDERMNRTDRGDGGCEDEEIGGEKGRIRFLRCVEAMYGDKGREMVTMADAEPEKLLPVVRRRLHQKIGELEIASQKQEDYYTMARR